MASVTEFSFMPFQIPNAELILSELQKLALFIKAWGMFRPIRAL